MNRLILRTSYNAILRASSSLSHAPRVSLVLPHYTPAVFPRYTSPQPARCFSAGGAHHPLPENEIVDRVLNIVRCFDKVDPKKVTPTSSFSADLGLDSLDAVEIVMAFEEEFSIEIPDADADQIKSTKDAIEYIKKHPQAK